MNKTLSLFILGALLSVACQTQTDDHSCEEPLPSVGIVSDISDDDLLELVQKQTFRYFWDFGHPVSGLARERSNTVKGAYYWDYINEAWGEPNFSEHTYGPESIAVGGSGFGIMAMTVAAERGWISRDAALRRLHKIVDFLLQAETFHGAFPHFMHGENGKAITFGRLDDGADIVETSYLMMGLLTAREYFNGDTPLEQYLRAKITQMWEGVNWAWFEKDGKLFWHWSPNQGFDMNFPIYGWNECLITYIMAASSPCYPISKDVYERCWKGGIGYRNTREYYGITAPLGDWGESLCGPLFFEQYTFQGIDPNALVDEDGVNYFEQGKAQALLKGVHPGPQCLGFDVQAGGSSRNAPLSRNLRKFP